MIGYDQIVLLYLSIIPQSTEKCYHFMIYNINKEEKR